MPRPASRRAPTRPETERAALSEHPLSDLIDRCDLSLRHEPAGFDPERLTDIQWRADTCTPGSILCFQRFDDGRSDTEILERYLADSPFAALFTNRVLDCFDRLRGKAVYVTAPGAWGPTLERLCDHFLPRSPGDWQIAGVTGTNGKTTTVKYLEAMLLAEGRRVLGIGTLGLTLNGASAGGTGFTSPPYIELRRILKRHRDDADTLVMEMSSHALDQGRVHGLRLAAAAWTNFSQDHLDYHHDEASYFAAKARILDLLGDGTPLLTTSPDLARRLNGHHGSAPVELVEPAAPPAGVLRERPFLALEYNRANLALAEGMAERLLDRAPAEPWRALAPVDGRFETRVHGNRTLVVDFAHTPDALDKVLETLRAHTAGRLVCVFGCGGDRDAGKRPLMAGAAERHADELWLTSDNPRSEPPERIIADMRAGLAGCRRVRECADRAEAVRQAIAEAQPGDTVLVAGKGHESYQEIAGQRLPFSDRALVADLMQEAG